MWEGRRRLAVKKDRRWIIIMDEVRNIRGGLAPPLPPPHRAPPARPPARCPPPLKATGSPDQRRYGGTHRSR